MKETLSIEIVSTRNVDWSSMSAPSRQAAQDALRSKYHDVRITMIDSEADLRALCRRSPDVVFLGAKYMIDKSNLFKRTNKIWLADYLASQGIAHTGSSSLAHRRELYKPLGKRVVNSLGIPTAAYKVVSRHDRLSKNDISMRYPLFVKPAGLGGGEGIDENSVVHTFEQLRAKVNEIHDLHDDALVETYLPGREFSVGILRNHKTNNYMTMPIELIAQENTNGDRILGQKVKSSNTEKVSGVTDGPLARSVNKVALSAFKALGGSDYGRIDIRLDAHGTPHFLEANLIPSLIKNYGSFPKACMTHLSMPYDVMLHTIVALSRERNAEVEKVGHAAVDNLGLIEAHSLTA